jgi:uncharacterized membrane protein YfcA
MNLPEWYNIVGLIAVGIISGFINTIAGSGSLITLPFLMFMGLSPSVANGTNRIGILFQSVVGVWGYKQQNLIDFKVGLSLLIPAIFGSIVGAFLAVDLNERILEITIAILMITMFFVILLKPEKWIKTQAEAQKDVPTRFGLLQIIVFFIIGLYGGFIQAGVGFFLLSGLVLSAGFDLIRANALKILIVLAFTPFALIVFIYNDQIDYLLGAILALGNMLGAYLASRYATKIGVKTSRNILLIVILISSIKLLLGN